ncbi:hypothetical protein SBRCBS47491_009859 [Sporothrix bragantina]|uniref:Glucuronyl hydrolase n=1 Tax=Sporothrix bragantina TaxID=671064 RepID=A0ABP0CZ72_9PEZI
MGSIGNPLAVNGTTSHEDATAVLHLTSDINATTPLGKSIRLKLSNLFSENVTAKITRAAVEQLKNNNPPVQYPEIVPQSGSNKGHYQSREVEFWISGFFPGCIYAVLERAIKFPSSLGLTSEEAASCLPLLRKTLEVTGKTWSDPLRSQASRTNTHDLGFMIMPHMRPRWELYHDRQALDTIITAAESLGSRYDGRLAAIRSWDNMDWHDGVNITSMEDNFLVIIDSMCNMDLLYYAAAQAPERRKLAEIATTHARTLLKSHLRPETSVTRKGYTGTLYSTVHLVNFDPKTGQIQASRTAQGYAADSTWSRGQAWAILGYAQCFAWTGNTEFLHAACGLIEYFLYRLEVAPSCVDVVLPDLGGRTAGRYVPLWDFDAPIEDPFNPLRDASAGVAAANGMVILSQALRGYGQDVLARCYLEAAVTIVKDTMDLSLAREKVQMHVDGRGALVFQDVEEGRFDSILKHSTVNNNSASHPSKKHKDHGLVYADYYLLEFATLLTRLGIC